jgi:hypothetical protein
MADSTFLGWHRWTCFSLAFGPLMDSLYGFCSKEKSTLVRTGVFVYLQLPHTDKWVWPASVTLARETLSCMVVVKVNSAG